MIEIKFSGESLAEIKEDIVKLGGALVMECLGLSVKPDMKIAPAEGEEPEEKPLKYGSRPRTPVVDEKPAKRPPGRPRQNPLPIEPVVEAAPPAAVIVTEEDARVALTAVSAQLGIDAALGVNAHFGIGKIRELDKAKLASYIEYCKKLLAPK